MRGLGWAFADETANDAEGTHGGENTAYLCANGMKLAVGSGPGAGRELFRLWKPQDTGGG
jgi:hypothetical protein